ncbi:hypothetical protein JCM10213_004871 [Rhodosporidiobolus nylandii]
MTSPSSEDGHLWQPVRPVESYHGFAATSLPSRPADLASVQPSPDSLNSAPDWSHAQPLSGQERGRRVGLDDEASQHRTATGKLHETGPAFASLSSLPCSASTTSELVMSAASPSPGLFYAPPPPRAPTHSVSAREESIASPVRFPTPPFPRPDSPLPPLPPHSTSQRIRAPAKTSSSSSIPAPLTSHTSLAAFKAHYRAASSQTKRFSAGGGSSEDTHRTSSDVDLDFSFEYDARKDVKLSLSDDSLVEEALAEEETLVVPDQQQPREWVGIDMRPAEHDIPESHLVRSSSGQLVGARHERAASAMDLRAQFKAGEMSAQTAPADVAITMNVEPAEEQHRRKVREGKRPVEGERAVETAVWMHEDVLSAPLARPQPPSAVYRRSVGRGFAYNPTETLAVPPLSAPPQYQATFAERQQQPPLRSAYDVELDDAKRSRAFPLPLRLLDRTKRTANALVSPVLNTAASFGGGKATNGTAHYESDAESVGPSPLFDDDFDGTIRTAPSTPNDTPLFQECFDEDDTAPPIPVPHRLGSSANPPLPLAGLGLDFGGGKGLNDFPVIPLRQSRRISLPPDVTRRRSFRQSTVLPSFAISPPQDRSSEDGTTTSSDSSDALSQDSMVDPTASPSRRLSRRYSSTAATQPLPAARQHSVHFEQSILASSSSLGTKDHTPDRHNGPSVRTPQHLLITPTPKKGLSPSFSFSPAPLRLVKAQLLRAAGYDIAEPPTASLSAPTGPEVQREQTAVQPGSRPASPRTVARDGVRRRTAVWDDLTDLLSSSPAMWLDEVVPAKLAFIAGFLFGPWCWILGGWWLRSLDGELSSTRGQRCRDPDCGCGRFLRGSALREHSTASSALSKDKAAKLNPHEPEMWAGLDRWVFLCRVAAGGGGVGVAVIFAVAVWAAATA